MKLRFSWGAALFAASLSVAYADSDAGAVFVMSNSADHNEVLTFSRSANGKLQATGRVSTEGRGSGGTTDPLGSQGSLTLSSDNRFLFAVNAGSGSISSFRVHGDDLRLVDVTHSGGSAPVAVAQWGDLVYVLNFAGNSSVVGFRLDEEGRLTEIHNSIRYLSTANSGASSLAFTPDGKSLIVTEKLNNLIDVFPVRSGGRLGTVVATKDPSAGLFDVVTAQQNTVIALEAGAGSISSFLVEAGALMPIGTPAATNGQASCWSVVTPDGKWVYTANSGSSTISGFRIVGAGSVTPVVPGSVVATLPAGSTDLDIAVSADSKFLYSLNSGAGSVGVFKINADGTLTSRFVIGAFTATSGFNGIAAY